MKVPDTVANIQSIGLDLLCRNWFTALGEKPHGTASEHYYDQLHLHSAKQTLPKSQLSIILLSVVPEKNKSLNGFMERILFLRGNQHFSFHSSGKYGSQEIKEPMWGGGLELCYLICLTVVTPLLLRGAFGSVTGPFIVVWSLSCWSREDISKGNFSSTFLKKNYFKKCFELQGN